MSENKVICQVHVRLSQGLPATHNYPATPEAVEQVFNDVMKTIHSMHEAGTRALSFAHPPATYNLAYVVGVEVTFDDPDGVAEPLIGLTRPR